MTMSLQGQVEKIEYYTFTHNTVDTTSIRSYLLFNKQESLFVWKSLNQKSEKSKDISLKDENKISFKRIYRDTIGTQVYNNYHEKKLILREPILDKNFKIIDSKLKLKWKFTNQVKKIGGFNCQKAETYYRGRIYYAWYTTSIPVPTGPWKLNGLPGLIIEAYDKNREVNFLFKKYNSNKNNKELLRIEIDKSTISMKDFVEKKDKAYRNIISQALLKLPRGVKIIESKSLKRPGIELTYEWEEE
jgi:GLPGLI family protein